MNDLTLTDAALGGISLDDEMPDDMLMAYLASEVPSCLTHSIVVPTAIYTISCVHFPMSETCDAG